jgi:hypothetical protein
MTLQQHIQTYEDAVRKGMAWILAQRNADASFGDPGLPKTTYFKLPMALFDNGYRAEAMSFMRHLVRHTFTDEGDFDEPRTGYHAAHWPYRNLWFIRASHFLEMYGVSCRATDYLLRFRNPDTGGVLALAPLADQQADPREDLILTAFGGLNMLTTGYCTEAEAAGEWLSRLIEAQPDLDHRLYLMWRPETGVVTEAPQDHDPKWYRVETGALNEDHYNLGVAFTFLSHIFIVTGKQRFLDTAMAYYRFFQSCREDRLETLSSGKVLYGLTWLFHATGDDHFLDEARTAADHLVAIQGEDGHWEQHGGPYVNIASEYAFELRFLIEVLKAL